MRRPRRPPATVSRHHVGGPHWAAPQLLISGFALLLAVVFALTGGAPRVAPPPTVAVGDAPRPPVVVEVRFVVVDARGLERPGYADVALSAADDPSARLTATLGALRDDLLASGTWPAGVDAATGFVIELDRRRIAVVDVPELPLGARIGVADELSVMRSLVATARAAATADEVRITVAGEERPSLWGKVAPPRG
ncbi:MAG: GerMN domain-containing protein [Trueperaceae bacterium]|nr:GerMN domain-containing protein [Trueperaceae bacterium]